MNKIMYKILWWIILNLEVQKKKSRVYFHLRWYKVYFQVSFNLDKTKNIAFTSLFETSSISFLERLKYNLISA